MTLLVSLRKRERQTARLAYLHHVLRPPVLRPHFMRSGGRRVSGERSGEADEQGRGARSLGGGAASRPRKCLERSAKGGSCLLQSLPGTWNGLAGAATHPPRPCVPGLERHFVTTRSRVDFLSRDEKVCFEFLDWRPDCANQAASSAEPLEQVFGLARESLQLPLVARSTHRENRGPKRPVDKRVLMVQEFCEEDIRVISKLRQNGEDEMSLGMAPP